jgi:hypothetical protein
VLKRLTRDPSDRESPDGASQVICAVLERFEPVSSTTAAGFLGECPSAVPVGGTGWFQQQADEAG